MSNNNLDQNDISFSLQELIFLFNKFKKIILLIIGISILLNMLLVFISLPRYQASTTIFIEDDASKNNPLFAMSLRREFNTIDNEIQILKSRTIAKKAIDKVMESDQKDNVHLLFTRNENSDLLNLPQQAIRKILLLERNNYFGGRILQIQENINNTEYSFPAGAARFNKNHKEVIKLLSEF